LAAVAALPDPRRFVETYLKSPQQFEAGETLLWHEPANLMRGFRGVGGHRYLTDRRLLFAPNRVERWIRSRPWSCPLEAVDDIGTAEARTACGRKLLVSAGGESVRFVVRDPATASAALRGLLEPPRVVHCGSRPRTSVSGRRYGHCQDL
jgi:hypothetical protein